MEASLQRYNSWNCGGCGICMNTSDVHAITFVPVRFRLEHEDGEGDVFVRWKEWGWWMRAGGGIL